MLHEINLIGIVQSVTIQVCVQATHLMHVCLIRQQIWLAVAWLMTSYRFRHVSKQLCDYPRSRSGVASRPGREVRGLVSRLDLVHAAT